MTKVAIAIAHGHTAKYLQIAVHSLQTLENIIEPDIYIAETWPGHPSIKAVTESDLGHNITVIPCVRRKHSHATALEEILEAIEGKGYDFLFAMETDTQAMKAGWLDWYVNFMKDEPTIGLAGFFWHEGDHHYNINPSATLYRVDMLQQYHKEARANNEGMFWHPRGNKPDNTPGMDNTIKDVVGCFAETRGIKNPTDVQKDAIVRGVPEAAWFEPGQWLYCRLQGEWKEARVPVDHIYMQFPGHTAPEGTYYGSKADPQFIHRWGGTRAYDWKKHRVDDHFVKSCAPMWIAREDKLWKEFVPESYRGIVHELNQEEDILKLMNDNLGFIIPEAL